MDEDGMNSNKSASVEDRMNAIQSVLEARGMEPAAAIEQAHHRAEEDWVPRNGARIIAKAWTDPA